MDNEDKDFEGNVENKLKILEKTAREYYDSGKDEFKKERYNSCVVLFFKSLVAFIDLLICQKVGNTPSSHTKRFNLTKNNFPEVYNLLDKDFPFYQDSYVHIMTKELAEVIKDDAEFIAKKVKISL